MLKGSMENPDINGNTFTRQRMHNSANSFKIDRRKFSQHYKFVPHHVIELHGARYLVCVRDADSGAVMLYESSALNDTPYAITDCHPLKYTEMLAEAREQLTAHLWRKMESAQKRKTGTKQNG